MISFTQCACVRCCMCTWVACSCHSSAVSFCVLVLIWLCVQLVVACLVIVACSLAVAHARQSFSYGWALLCFTGVGSCCRHDVAAGGYAQGWQPWQANPPHSLGACLLAATGSWGHTHMFSAQLASAVHSLHVRQPATSLPAILPTIRYART